MDERLLERVRLIAEYNAALTPSDRQDLRTLLAAARQGEPQREPMRIYYMRDNHTFVGLPLDEERAIERMRQELEHPDKLGRHGMLCSKQIEITLHHHGDDDAFLAAARPLIRKAIAAAPTEVGHDRK